MTTRSLSYIGATAAVLAAIFVASAASIFKAQAASSISSGDLIRGTSFSAVYYMGADGFRYVFPNDKTYFTWYSNFNTVEWITDAELADIQIGGNVTYKPGSKMIKINTDPKVYFVTNGGVIRPVADEATATLMYGSSWNTKIDDVADGFFGNYTVSSDEITSDEADIVNQTANFADTINEDKGLIAPETINITSNGYSPIDVEIEAGQTVRFTNTDTAKHSVTADDLSWGSGTLQAGDSFVRRFEEAGTYTFFDSYDSSNTGAIFVE